MLGIWLILSNMEIYIFFVKIILNDLANLPYRVWLIFGIYENLKFEIVGIHEINNSLIHECFF